MNVHIVMAIWLAWPPIVVILFRMIGPPRAVLVGLLGGLLFLPIGQVQMGPPRFAFPVDKWNVTGLGLLLGALIFDHRSLLKARPAWLDLPMAVYYLAPLVGLATGVPGSGADILDLMIGRGLGWVVPYAMARLYFGASEGPSRVLFALTMAGLSYIPVCLYEEVAGPSNYLSPLIYGTQVDQITTDRLGGWRPVGFLYNGLEVAAWMALTTVAASWLWLGGGWSSKWYSWLTVLSLFATSLSCRGVYGYILLAIGIVLALSTRWLRSRAILIVCMAVPLAYIGLRVTGIWDGMILVNWAELTGRGGTVAFRINAENELIQRVADRNLAFGFGNYVWHADWAYWPDGIWLRALWLGGIVGLTLQLLALHLLPATLAISRPRERPDPQQATSPFWGLASWSILTLIDGMHNASYFTPTALVAGTLVGSFLSKKSSHVHHKSIGKDRLRISSSAPLIVTIILLVVIEILGHSEKSTSSRLNDPASSIDSRKPLP